MLAWCTVDMAVLEGKRHDGALARMNDHAFNAVVHRSSHISILSINQALSAS